MSILLNLHGATDEELGRLNSLIPELIGILVGPGVRNEIRF